MTFSRSDARGYVLAVLTTGTAAAVTRFTWPLFAGAPFAPLFASVAATTQWGGRTPGLLAILLATCGSLLAFPAGDTHPWSRYTLLVFLPVAVIANLVVSGRNRANAALRARETELRATLAAQQQAALELRISEQKLRHVQKLEAVGQLVAGVAHNFNNLLTVTLGYTDLLLDARPSLDADREHLEQIRKATERGAALTRQLLAFGHKHDAALARVDVNRTVAELREMLTRVIREDIELTIDISRTPAAITIDPDDIEQAILNLVLNARDALPSGGSIEIEVARKRLDAQTIPSDVSARPGEYISLRVRDNGTGMTPEVQAHLFEPFFTTKEVGQGTGLGLAFVYGIARQAGGFVTVDTAPRKGTAVTLYFPPAGEGEETVQPTPVRLAAARQQGGATILLVEDEATVRDLTARALTRAGYRVLPAATPTEACALFAQRGADIDLLLTDVVMPEMHGPALARQLVARRPDLPVLFMSGYSDAIPADAAATEKALFLAKPFTPVDLLTAVADLLPRV
jgi:two-component system, cell cycle sensor histidine kinase and response regulator CckA